MPNIPSSETLSVTGSADFSNATNFHAKAQSITNSALAITPIREHTSNFGLAIGAAPVVYESPEVIARGAGTIKYVYAGLVESGSSTDVDFDLKINGTTALSAVINVVHGSGDRGNVAGVLSTTAVSSGDVVSMSIATVTSSTGAQGPFMVVGIEPTATAS